MLLHQSFCFQPKLCNRRQSYRYRLKANNPQQQDKEKEQRKTLPAGFENQGFNYNSWKSGFSTCQEEICVVLDGDVPKDLHGTYFRNGHGAFEVGVEKQPVLHPFDGDGLVIAAQFWNGKVIFRNRFVQTEGYKKEKHSKGVMFRNTFGTQRKGGFWKNFFDLDVKNIANTNIIYRANRLLALWEGGLPHRLEADSLDTVGEDTLNNILEPNSQLSAHPRIDSKTGNMVIPKAIRSSPDKVEYTVYEFNEDMEVEKKRTFDIPGFVFIHDFAVTEHYYIFNQPPITLDPLPFIFGQKCIVPCMSLDTSRNSKLFLVPRDSAKDIAVIEIEPHFSFHCANAFDEGNDKVILDLVKSGTELLFYPTSNPDKAEWKDLGPNEALPYSTLHRYKLEKNNISGNWVFSSEQLSPTLVEFPSVSPSFSCKSHKYIYASCGASRETACPVQGLFKFDVEEQSETTWFGNENEFLGECIFVPRESATTEDDGYVLSMLWNGQDNISQLVVFDAKDITKGPISRLTIPTESLMVYMDFGPMVYHLKQTLYKGVLSNVCTLNDLKNVPA
eukprot:CAMPEP_0117763500 /NCGR_PEP_ID=MMETSP0947-20121206/18695_1 /TAXON_ID=44440 /ORGANISM="Chattonella subsalsa, Strain CCMP2191" /LENGTH=558 /DNA_ID=CAMNT_0005585259 /DNA_START=30 /DNA_END=1707 /DNA_ORIENTATION=-